MSVTGRKNQISNLNTQNSLAKRDIRHFSHFSKQFKPATAQNAMSLSFGDPCELHNGRFVSFYAFTRVAHLIKLNPVLRMLHIT